MKSFVSAEDFKDCRQRAALTWERVAELLGVTPRTIQNWEKGRCRIPYAAFELLRLKTGAALPYPGFEGWQFRDGVMISPADHVFSAADLDYLWLTFEMAREWQRERGLLPARQDACEPPMSHGGVAQATAAGNPSAGRAAADLTGDGGLPRQPRNHPSLPQPPTSPASGCAAAATSPRPVIRGESNQPAIKVLTC